MKPVDFDFPHREIGLKLCKEAINEIYHGGTNGGD